MISQFDLSKVLLLAQEQPEPTNNLYAKMRGLALPDCFSRASLLNHSFITIFTIYIFLMFF